MELPSTVSDPVSDEPGHLLRILGVTFGLAVTVGGTLGVGILRTPGTIAAGLGDKWLILGIWTLGGLYALLGTIAVAELATSLPQAGGWYVYARRAYGEYAGFVIGWVNWTSFCCALGVGVIAAGDYAASLVPGFPGGSLAISVSATVLFTLLHWLGLRMGSRSQEVMCLLSAIGFVILIAACFGFGRDGTVSAAPAPVMPGTGAAITLALVLAFQSVIFTYDGWYGAVYFSEENANPASLPRAMIGSVLIIIAIYLLVNCALLYVLPMGDLAASPLAAADAAARVFGGNAGTIVTTLAVISLFSVINATFMQTPRIIFGMSRDGLFFHQASHVNLKGTPHVALLATSAVVLGLIVVGSFDRLLAVMAFYLVVMYASGFAALVAVRRSEPDLPRPFRAYGYPFTIYIILALSAVFLVGIIISDLTNSLIAIAGLVVSYPIFLVFKRLKSSGRRTIPEA